MVTPLLGQVVLHQNVSNQGSLIPLFLVQDYHALDLKQPPSSTTYLQSDGFPCTTG